MKRSTIPVSHVSKVLQNALHQLSGHVTPKIKVARPHYQEVYKTLLGTSTIFVAGVLFDNDDGVGDGVTREVFWLFWDALVGTLYRMAEIYTSLQSPHARMLKSEILGRILGFTLIVLFQFPSNCMSETLCQANLRLQLEK